MAPYVDTVLEGYKHCEAKLDTEAQRVWITEFKGEMVRQVREFLTKLSEISTRPEQARFIENARRMGRDENPANKDSKVPFLDLIWLSGGFDSEKGNYHILSAFCTRIPKTVTSNGRVVEIEIEDMSELGFSPYEIMTCDGGEEELKNLAKITSEKKDPVIPAFVLPNEDEEGIFAKDTLIVTSKMVIENVKDVDSNPVTKGFIIYNSLNRPE